MLEGGAARWDGLASGYEELGRPSGKAQEQRQGGADRKRGRIGQASEGGA